MVVTASGSTELLETLQLSLSLCKISSETTARLDASDTAVYGKGLKSMTV